MQEVVILCRNLRTGELTLFFKDEDALKLLKAIVDNKIACQKVKTGLPIISSEEAKDKFLILRRVFLFNKEGKYTDTEVLHFLAGWCHYAPEGEEVKLLQY